MKTNKHRKALLVAIHTSIITILAVALSYTLIYSFTSMLALKSSVEVKDYQFSDLYNVVTDKSVQRRVSDNVVLLAVDGLSREAIAEVINFARDAQPKAIGVDIIFEHQYEGDSTIIAATSAANIVMAERFAPDDDFAITKSYFYTDNHEARCGLTNIEQGVVRHYCSMFEINKEQIQSFASEIAEMGEFDKQKANDNEYISFPSVEFRCIYPDMLVENPERCCDIMKDKIVLVGDMEDIHDMHQTPIGVMSGLSIQATIIETIVGGYSVREVPGWVGWAIAIFSCAVLVLLNLFLSKSDLATGKLLFRLAQITVLYLYFWIGCTLFARCNIYVDFAPALSMIAIGLLAYDIYFGILALYDKMKVKQKNRKV